jgi:hypothetical protein
MPRMRRVLRRRSERLLMNYGRNYVGPNFGKYYLVDDHIGGVVNRDVDLYGLAKELGCLYGEAEVMSLPNDQPTLPF